MAGAEYMAIFASLYKMGISIYGGGQVNSRPMR